jgi:hypothetical protein
MQSPVIHLLWTGGLDSSYRMVRLSRRPVRVQPYYISDNRQSERQELKAIAEIAADIQGHPKTQCEILPLVVVRVEDIGPDAKITQAYRRLRRATDIGSQYDWLARFAKSVERLELCVEKSESSIALNCILKYGELTLQDLAPNGPCYVIDEKSSSDDLVQVFGAFLYPVIDKTKPEMIREFTQLGHEAAMHKTWFCFTPIGDEPCGMCNPCKSAIEEGLRFRFTETALKRYENPPRMWRLKGAAKVALSELRLLDAAIALRSILTRRG